MGLSVDIDIGGSRLDEIEDEDVVPVEEVEEVEEVKEVEVLEGEKEPEPTTKPPAAAKKDRRVWVKRLMVGAVVVVLIIVGLIAFIYFRTEVSDVNVSLESDPKSDRLNVTVLVGSTGTASIAGEADLEITYDDDVIHTSKISINDDGTGKATIPYNSFIEGNGNYYVTVEYEGVESPPAEYSVDYIVEEIEIGVWDDYSKEYKLDARVVEEGGQLKGELNLTVFMDTDAPRAAEITVDEIKNTDDNSYLAQEELPQLVTEGFYQEGFSYSQSGNYSISVTLKNSLVKSTSNYYTVTDTWSGFLNIRPEANMDVEHQSDDLLTYTVELDASLSWNDGDITTYYWDFGDGETYTETADDFPDGAFDGITTHTYSTLGTTTGANLPQGSYLTTLNVKGDVIDSNTEELETGGLTVQVDAP
ncbi:MAG: hypothetical protein JSV56_02340 [Methanomassiliicoccales archaeon]|nr:MAG: hypothetical protein JSV56_02340 [Methanomassiliicoccales archaeon]